MNDKDQLVVDRSMASTSLSNCLTLMYHVNSELMTEKELGYFEEALSLVEDVSNSLSLEMAVLYWEPPIEGYGAINEDGK